MALEGYDADGAKVLLSLLHSSLLPSAFLHTTLENPFEHPSRPAHTIFVPSRNHHRSFCILNGPSPRGIQLAIRQEVGPGMLRDSGSFGLGLAAAEVALEESHVPFKDILGYLKD